MKESINIQGFHTKTLLISAQIKDICFVFKSEPHGLAASTTCLFLHNHYTTPKTGVPEIDIFVDKPYCIVSIMGIR